MSNLQNDFYGERENAIRAIFQAFGKKYDDESIAFVLRKTAGINTLGFVDACRKLEGMDELPRNISRELINLAGRKADTFVSCENCCVYENGRPLMIAGERKMYTPGMRKYYYTQGDLYDRVGFSAPCNCDSGRRILQGMKIAGFNPEKTKNEFDLRIIPENEVVKNVENEKRELVHVADELPF